MKLAQSPIRAKLARSSIRVKMARSLCEVGPKFMRSSCKVGPKFVRSWPEVRAKLARSSCEVGPKFARSFAAKFALKCKHIICAYRILRLYRFISRISYSSLFLADLTSLIYTLYLYSSSAMASLFLRWVVRSNQRQVSPTQRLRSPPFFSLLHTFHSILRTLLHETPRVSALNAICHGRHLVTSTYFSILLLSWTHGATDKLLISTSGNNFF